MASKKVPHPSGKKGSAPKRGAKSGASKGGSRPGAKEPPEREELSERDELVYAVASLAYEKALGVEAITQELRKRGLWKSKDPNDQVRDVTNHRVRTALQRAKGTVVVFRSPPREGLEASFAKEFTPRSGQPPVVRIFDDKIRYADWASFFTFAAQFTLEQVQGLAERSRPSAAAGDAAQVPRRTVIANAGGPSVAEMVKSLGQMFVEPDPRLLFISLSAVGKPDRFNLSPNYLAVRLAEIFGAAHRAPENFAQPGPDYRRYLGEIDMLIGGVGSSSNGFLAQELRARGKCLPSGTVGDVFYLPFQEDGSPADSDQVRSLISELHIHPTYEEFQSLRARSAVRLLVIPPPGAHPGSAPPLEGLPPVPHPHHKDAILRIALMQGLATHVVLPESMAARMLEQARRQHARLTAAPAS